MSKFILALHPSAATIIVALAIITGGAATVAPNASAQGSENAIERQTTPPSDDSQDRLRIQQRESLENKQQEAQTAKEAAEARLKARHEARQEKLSASKLEICKNRETNINNRISRIADRSSKHLELFNTISERTQAFYVDKGNTLANYDELVADVSTKKVAAETAISTITSTTASFDCEGENPKVTIEEFKTSLKTSIDVLKEYRTSVKNLIVGIKSVNSVPADNTTPTASTEE